jgi:hypothetical protein
MNEDDHVRDVYAHYGLAMYLAQCLEQSIFIHLMFFDFFPRNTQSYRGAEHWQQEFDRYESAELGKTMGKLIQKLKEAGQPTEEINSILIRALKARNRLAHHFFSEQAVNFMSELGRNKMITELESAQALLRSAAKTIDASTMPVARRYGFTEEMEKRAINELMEQQRKANNDI